MVAPAVPSSVKPTTATDRSPSRDGPVCGHGPVCDHGPVCEWRLVDHFNTVEDAELAVDSLRKKGIQAQVSLIDGLSVIAKRSQACDQALC